MPISVAAVQTQTPAIGHELEQAEEQQAEHGGVELDDPAPRDPGGAEPAEAVEDRHHPPELEDESEAARPGRAAARPAASAERPRGTAPSARSSRDPTSPAAKQRSGSCRTSSEVRTQRPAGGGEEQQGQRQPGGDQPQLGAENQRRSRPQPQARPLEQRQPGARDGRIGDGAPREPGAAGGHAGGRRGPARRPR